MNPRLNSESQRRRGFLTRYLIGGFRHGESPFVFSACLNRDLILMTRRKRIPGYQNNSLGGRQSAAGICFLRCIRIFIGLRVERTSYELSIRGQVSNRVRSDIS